MREYDVKQWEKNGKAMENLSRTLGKLITTVETLRRGSNDAKSRKARVKHWKSNGKMAVLMCDHYGVDARKENHGRNEQNRLCGATVGIVE